MVCSEEIINKTREHFAVIHRRCIDNVRNGTKVVNNPESYIAWRETAIKDGLAGKYDHTLSFQQMAHYLETGECVSLLSK